MSDEKNLLNEIKTTFEDFKAANDARLAAIESKGSADVLDSEKVDRINNKITELEAEVKAARRPEPASEESAEDMEYRTAYRDWAFRGEMSPELKAMSVGSNADGGYAVPTIIDGAISSKLVQVSPMRQVAKVVSVKSPSFNHLVNLHNTGMSGWVGETAARTETTTPQLLSIAIPNGEVYANAAISQWMVDGDSVIDGEKLIGEELAAEFAKVEGAAFISGNGTNKPSGFLNNTPTTSGSDSVLQYVAGGGASTLTASDPLINLVYKLASPYRANGKFLMNAATTAVVRTLKDTTGNYLWAPGLNGDQNAKLCGFEVVECPDMPDIGANTFPIAFGDFNAGYLIIDRRQTLTLRDPYSNKPYVMIYAAKRLGGKLVLPEAIKVLKIAAS